MGLEINLKYRTRCGAIAATKMRSRQNDHFIIGEIVIDNNNHIGLYDRDGFFYPEVGAEHMEDDPFDIVSEYREPKTVYFLSHQQTGELYESATGPMVYHDLESAQRKCQALNWVYVPIRLVETEGVR
jgi:hypothetical protein